MFRNCLLYRYLSLRWDSPAPSFPSSPILWPWHLLALRRQLMHLVYFPSWFSCKLLGPFASLINICKNPGFSVSLCFHVLFSAFLAELIWHKYLCVKGCSPSPQCPLLYTLPCGEPWRLQVWFLCVPHGAQWPSIVSEVIGTEQMSDIQSPLYKPHSARPWKISQRAPRLWNRTC